MLGEVRPFLHKSSKNLLKLFLTYYQNAFKNHKHTYLMQTFLTLLHAPAYFFPFTLEYARILT